MHDARDCFAIIDAALDAANADEADAAFISSDSNISRFANSNIHQNMSEISAELTLRLFVGGAMGIASTTSFDADAVAEMAGIAREAARHSPPLPNFKGWYRGRDAACPPPSAARTLPAPADTPRTSPQALAPGAK